MISAAMIQRAGRFPPGPPSEALAKEGLFSFFSANAEPGKTATLRSWVA